MEQKSYRFFYTPSKFAENNFIVCDGMGYENNKNFIIDRSFFNNYLMMYVISGEIFVKQGGVKYTVTKASSIIMDLTQNHKYYFDREKGGSIAWFHFRGAPCAPIMRQLNQAKKLPAVLSFDKMLTLTEDIFEATKELKASTEYLISTKVYNLLYEALGETLSESLSSFDRDELFVTNVKNYIKANITAKMSLEDLAKSAGLSKYHFSHKFKQKFGVRLCDYLTEQKVTTAQQLLLCTNDSVAQIAQVLNFNDQSYFTNVFKRSTGITPIEYRKQFEKPGL